MFALHIYFLIYVHISHLSCKKKIIFNAWTPCLAGLVRWWWSSSRFHHKITSASARRFDYWHCIHRVRAFGWLLVRAMCCDVMMHISIGSCCLIPLLAPSRRSIHYFNSFAGTGTYGELLHPSQNINIFSYKSEQLCVDVFGNVRIIM